MWMRRVEDSLPNPNKAFTTIRSFRPPEGNFIEKPHYESCQITVSTPNPKNWPELFLHVKSRECRLSSLSFYTQGSVSPINNFSEKQGILCQSKGRFEPRSTQKMTFALQYVTEIAPENSQRCVQDTRIDTISQDMHPCAAKEAISLACVPEFPHMILKANP